MLRQRGRHQADPAAPPTGGGAADNVFTLPTQLGDLHFPSALGSPGVPAIPDGPVESGHIKRDVSPASQRFAKKIGPKDLMHFSRQLAAFIRAGIPILDALELLAIDNANPSLAAVLVDIQASLRQGGGLSESFDAHPKAFPPAYRSMIHSAELTGNLDTVLDRLATYLERDTEARAKIKSALTYPAVIAGMSVVVVIILTTFVLPKFKPFFASFHKQLPLPTRILMAIADGVGTYWWLFLAVLIAIVAGVVAFVRSATTRPLWDRWKLRIPVLGEVLRYALIERFCRVLAAMLTAGVPIAESLRIAADACSNRYVEDQLAQARTMTIQGAGISAPLARLALFPLAATQMIRVGESTGQLDRQLEQAATYFERELGYKIKRFTTLIEPAVIIVMGVIVGFVALALVSAMYGVFKGGKLG
jgi:type IV pilus assembly protein PilC